MTIIEVDHIIVYKFQWNVIDSNSYVIVGKEEAIIVDPIDSEELIEFLKKTKSSLYRVFLTHEHFDHISGINKLRSIFSCVIYANHVCSELIQNKKKNLSALANIIISGSKYVERMTVMPFACKAADVVFYERLSINWMGYTIVLISTPGHSHGSICILVDGIIIFTGDSLLVDYHVITRLPGGDRKIYQEKTCPFFMQLSKNIIVLPGHGEYNRLADIIKKYSIYL